MSNAARKHEPVKLPAPLVPQIAPLASAIAPAPIAPGSDTKNRIALIEMD